MYIMLIMTFISQSDCNRSLLLLLRIIVWIVLRIVVEKLKKHLKICIQIVIN